MRWFVKAVVYATVLTWPGHLAAHAYQSLLVALTGLATGQLLVAPTGGAVDLSAANLLTILAALCLASDFVSWRRRMLALAIGLPTMVVVEVGTGIAGMTLAGIAGPERVTRMPGLVLGKTLELSRWLAVPLLWGWLLGRYALHAGGPGRAIRAAATAPGGRAAGPRPRRSRRRRGTPGSRESARPNGL